MAKHRMIDTRFWDDSYIVRLDPSQKLLFLYLITNPLTNIIGLYEISLRRVAFDTGLDEGAVKNILAVFQDDGKIAYKDGWVMIANFEKHQTLLQGQKLEEAKKRIVDLLPDSLYVGLQGLLNQSSLSLSSLSLKKEGAASKNSDGPLIEHIAETYKSAINGRAQLTSGARAKIKHRLATYGTPALEKAINNFSKDTWQMKHNAHRGMAWFFHTDDRIEQYINLETKRKVEL